MAYYSLICTNMTTNITNKEKLLYPELSYQIMGILFEVHNKLGTKYQEKHYQNAVETKLKGLNLPYQREKQIKVKFENEILGEFYADFVISGKLLLELKRVWRISQDDIKQVLRYLDALGFKLGIIANFRHKRLEYRRVVN